MGAKCGKIENEVGPHHLTDTSSKSNVRDYQTFGVHPPHQVLHEDIEEISRTYRFFVHLWGIKCRNLKGVTNCFVVVNWDDFAFEKKTKPVQMGGFPRFNEAFQFTWTTSSIKGMDEKFLEVSVYEDDKHQGTLIGSVKVDLYEIATGPVHHDLKLIPNVTNKKLKDDCGRIVFDLQMSQICQLIINPVEIVAHINEPLPDSNSNNNNAASSHSGFFDDLSNVIDADDGREAAQQKGKQALLSRSLTSGGSSLTSTQQSQSSNLTRPSLLTDTYPNLPTHISSGRLNSDTRRRLSRSHTIHHESVPNPASKDNGDITIQIGGLSTTSTSAPNSAVGTDRTQGNNSLKLDPLSSSTACSSHQMVSSSQPSVGGGESIQFFHQTSQHPPPVLSPLLRQDEETERDEDILIDDVVDSLLLDAAGGGTSGGDDEAELVEGEWFLAFDPTGLAEGLQEPYRSLLTEKCIQPSWSSLVSISELTTKGFLNNYGGLISGSVSHPPSGGVASISTPPPSNGNMMVISLGNISGDSGVRNNDKSKNNFTANSRVIISSSNKSALSTHGKQSAPAQPSYLPPPSPGADSPIEMKTSPTITDNKPPGVVSIKQTNSTLIKSTISSKHEVYSEPPDLHDMRTMMHDIADLHDEPHDASPSGGSHTPPPVSSNIASSASESLNLMTLDNVSSSSSVNHLHHLHHQHHMLHVDAESVRVFNSNTVAPGSQLQASLAAWRASGSLENALPSSGKFKYGLKLEPLSSAASHYSTASLRRNNGVLRPILHDNATAADLNSVGGGQRTGRSSALSSSHQQQNLLLRDAPQSGHRRGQSSTLGLFEGLSDEELRQFGSSIKNNEKKTNSSSLVSFNNNIINNTNNSVSEMKKGMKVSPPPPLIVDRSLSMKSKSVGIVNDSRKDHKSITSRLKNAPSLNENKFDGEHTDDSHVHDLIVPETVTTPLPTQPPINVSSSNVQQQHQTSSLDLQLSYRRLAEICKGQRRLARELLSPVLPTMQLETTVEQLRQQHITVRLYVQRLGSDPRLFGEVWLPFVKLYDADIVDDIDKNFHDSYFKEPIWLYGRCRGYLEGLVLFQNNPVVAQMLSGVHTEDGRKRISPAIMAGASVGDASSGVSSFLVRSEHLLPAEVKKVALLHGELLDQLFQNKNSKSGKSIIPATFSESSELSGSVSPGPSGDLSSICEQLLLLLKQSHAETRKSYMYASTHALLTGQRVLLSLANHILDYLDSIQFNIRPLYSAVLHQIFKRGELDVGTCVPELPHSLRGEDLRTVYRLYRLVKKRHRSRLIAVGLISEEESGGKDKNGGGNSNKSGARNSGGKKGLLFNVFKRRSKSEALHTTADLAEMSDDDSVDLPFIPLAADVPAELKDLTCVGDMIAAYRRFGESKDDSEKRKVRAQELLNLISIDECEEVVLFHLRMRTCLAYLQVLYRTLYYSLDKFSNDAVFEGQKRFLSIFLCIAYFRIPSFRGELLSGLLSDEEKKVVIPEWRGTEFALDELSLLKMRAWSRQSELRVTLDWTSLYQVVLGYYGPHVVLDQAIVPIMQPRSGVWRDRMFKRSTAFFSFLDNWCKHVFQAAPRKGEGIRWHGVPGYPHLLKALLIEMRSRDVTRYPDSLLNCSGALLANERILSVFVKVLFLRTSAFNSSAVFAALNYLDYWTQVISLRGVSLPPSFDMTFLLRGIETLLSCGVCLNVAKTLWYLYKNLLVFSGARLKSIVIDLLLDRHFIPLLGSWAWIVRRCFIWIMLYRICESARHVMMRHVPYYQLTNDERLILEAYRILSERLKHLGAPPVFPAAKLYVALGFDSQGNPDPKIHPNGYDGYQARAQEKEGDKSTTNRMPGDSSAAKHVTTGIAVRVSTGNLNALKIDHAETGHRIGSFATFDGEAEHTLIGAAGLEKLRGDGLSPIPGKDPYKPYLDAAIVELSRELSNYRDWVISGGEHLPVLHIPSTPLDYTVDVPLENW